MRLPVPPLLARFAFALLLLVLPARAALTVTDTPPDPSALEMSRYSSEGDARTSDDEANSRVAEKKHEKLKHNIRKVLYVAVPLVLDVLGALSFAFNQRQQRRGPSRSKRRKEEHAADRRRTRHSSQVRDPRQW